MVIFDVVNGQVSLTPLESTHLIVSVMGQSLEIREINGRIEVSAAPK